MTGWGPFDLAGRNAMVTGGAMGIGFGIAEWLVKAGANVLIVDLNGEAASQAAARLPAGRAVALQADVSDPESGSVMVTHCVESFGSVDILVNNAGIYPFAPMMATTPALFDKVYAINLRGLAFCAKAAAAQMIQQGKGGKIINIASIDGLHPSMVGLAAYDSSKGGVVMFTRAFALEMGRHQIMVNAIAPGGIATEGTAQMGAATAEQIQAMNAKIPLGRMGVPEDIAKVAVFLASSASDYMTGEVMVVDGGVLLS